jgi:hypothetical protein
MGCADKARSDVIANGSTGAKPIHGAFAAGAQAPRSRA